MIEGWIAKPNPSSALFCKRMALPQNCHSEKRSAEESGVGFPQVSVNPPPQTPRFARGDTL